MRNTWIPRGLYIASLSVIASIAVAQNATEQVIQIPGPPGTSPTPVTIPYPFPDGATIGSATELTSLGNRHIDLHMQANVASSGGVLVKAVFSNGLMLVGCLNGASVPNYGISSGQAKLIDPLTEQVLGTGAIAVSGNTVRISASDLLVGSGQLTLVTLSTWGLRAGHQIKFLHTCLGTGGTTKEPRQ